SRIPHSARNATPEQTPAIYAPQSCHFLSQGRRDVFFAIEPIASQPDAGTIMISAFLMSLSAPSGVSPQAQMDFTLRPSMEAVRTLNRGFTGSPCSQFDTTP